MMTADPKEQLVHIPVDGVTLEGALVIPANAQGLVLFVHGSGSSRFSPRNNFVAQWMKDSTGVWRMSRFTATPMPEAPAATK